MIRWLISRLLTPWRQWFLTYNLQVSAVCSGPLHWAKDRLKSGVYSSWFSEELSTTTTQTTDSLLRIAAKIPRGVVSQQTMGWCVYFLLCNNFIEPQVSRQHRMPTLRHESKGSGTRYIHSLQTFDAHQSSWLCFRVCDLYFELICLPLILVQLVGC